jgi:hypothetical protein
MTQNYNGNSSISSNLSLEVLLRMIVEFTASNTSKRNQHLSLLLLAFQSTLGILNGFIVFKL